MVLVLTPQIIPVSTLCMLVNQRTLLENKLYSFSALTIQVDISFTRLMALLPFVSGFPTELHTNI